MADNILVTSSGSTTMATDDISSVHYPRVKVSWGADGSAVDASAANPLPVVQTGSLPAGTAAIGKLAANSGVIIGAVEQSGTFSVGLAPATSGGLSISRVISAASTNSTSVKGSAGQVYGWYISNTNAAVCYVKLYNKATAPTVGTDTPVMTICVPGSTTGGGTNVEFANGIAFGTGIGLGVTTAVADNSTAAVAANEVVINLLYK